MAQTIKKVIVFVAILAIVVIAVWGIVASTRKTHVEPEVNDISESEKQQETFINFDDGYKFDYPSTFSLNLEDGVVLDLPRSFQPQTNFNGAKITIASTAVSNDGLCITEESGLPMATSTENVNGNNFEKIEYSEAGAGNLYEVSLYRIVEKGKCFKIEYVIHSGNIHNYPEESGIVEFNKKAVVDEFEKVLNTFAFL